MTKFFTNDFAEMLDDAGNLIAEIDPNTIVDSVADEGPDAVKVRDRLGPDAIKVRDPDDPILVGWVARGKLTADSPVAPKLEIPRFIENAQDAANTINVAFAAEDKVELSSTLLLVFAWIESRWENAGTELPVPLAHNLRQGSDRSVSSPVPGRRRSPTRNMPRFCAPLPTSRGSIRICSAMWRRVASMNCRQHCAPQPAARQVPCLYGSPSSSGREEGSRFARLASGDRIDTVVDGQPALTAATISAHGELFSSGGTPRSRAEVEATVEAQLKEAAKTAADKAAEFNQTLDAARAAGREPSRVGMIFPMRQRPVQDYHTDDRQFGANWARGKRKHAGCDLIAAPGDGNPSHGGR